MDKKENKLNEELAAENKNETAEAQQPQESDTPIHRTMSASSCFLPVNRLIASHLLTGLRRLVELEVLDNRWHIQDSSGLCVGAQPLHLLLWPDL